MKNQHIGQKSKYIESIIVTDKIERFDRQPYHQKDVLYIGKFIASPDIEIRSNISTDATLYKFGVTSNIERRNIENSRTYPNFEIIHIVTANKMYDAFILEQNVKRFVKNMGLKLKYGNHQECYMATTDKLKQVLNYIDEFMKSSPDLIDTESYTYKLEEQKIQSNLEEQRISKHKMFIDLFSAGKITVDELREFIK